MQQRFDAALDRAFDLAPAHAVAAIGPFAVRLHAASAGALADWTDSLLLSERSDADFSMAFVEADDRLLRDFVPDDQDQVLVLEDDGYLVLWQPHPNRLLYMFDVRTRRGLMWAAEGRAPPWVYSRPLLPAIHAATLDTDWTPVHAAAVGRDGRFLVLAGGGGAGKTTAAIACAQEGWEYAGDDFVLVNAQTGEVAPLYTSARVRAGGPEALAAFVEATTIARTDRDGDVSYEVRLAGHPAGGNVRGGRISAWLLPQRRGSQVPEFAPARRSVGYQSLILMTTLQLPFGREAMASKILRMIGTAPVFTVDTGVSPAMIPAAFQEFLARLPE